MMPALLSLFATNKICQGCQNWPKKKHDSWHLIWIPYISQRGTYFFQTILSVGKFQYPSIGFELLFSMSFLHEFVPFCSFTSSISPKQHHLTPYPLCHVTMSEKKTNGFVYITSDLRNEWTADWRTWARSWKLWKLRPRRSWRTFPILQGRWLPRYADGWMKGRDDSGYRMLTWTCCKHTK